MRKNKVPAILEYLRSADLPAPALNSRMEIPQVILTDTIKSTFKDAAKKLTGSRKRDLMAKITEDYFDSSARIAETSIPLGGF